MKRRMKRVLSFVLAIVMMCSVMYGIDVTAYAEESWENISFNLDGVSYFTSDINKVIVERYTGNSYTVVIPEVVTYEGNEYVVTGMMSDVFRNNTTIKSVSLPDTIYDMSPGIFYGCSALESVKLPAYLININQSNAFASCSSLKEIEFPETIENISASELYLSGITENQDYWQNGMLIVSGILLEVDRNCTGTLVIPEGVRLIAYGAISYNDNITDVVFPSTLEMIGGTAFHECSGLVNITIPGNVKKIATNAFWRCQNLESVVIEEGVEEINYGVFSECSKLESVQLPSTLRYIEENAFEGTLVPSDSQSGDYRIGDVLLKSKVSYNTDTKYDGIKVVGTKADTNAEVLNLTSSIKSICNLAFSGSTFEEVVLPEGLVYIGRNAFYGCESLNSINIPSTVKEIGANIISSTAYYNDVNNWNSSYLEIDGCLLEYKESETKETITIPENVRIIGDEMFACLANGFSKVTLPDTLERIPFKGFADTKIDSIDIPKSVKEIDDFAFSNTRVEVVNYTGTKEEWNKITIGKANDDLKEATIICTDGTIGTHICADGTLVKGKAATCTKAGAKDYYTCSGCENWYWDANCTDLISNHDDVNIKAKGHTVVVDKKVAATCTKTGLTEGKHCSVCKTVIKKQQTIDKLLHKYKNVVTKATFKKSGKIVPTCTECKAKNKATIINKIGTVKLSKTSYTYDGKTKKPTVTVKDSKGKKISSKYYTVSYAKGRKNVGNYSVKITFKGNYSGTKTLYFKINPANTRISKFTAGLKQVVINCAKVAKQITGYQMQYANNKQFKNAKTVTTKKKNIITIDMSNSRVYTRVRTYRTVNGKKYYSGWSKVRLVKLK